MHVVNWPPEYTLVSAMENVNYQLASEYFILNLLLVTLALVFGAGFLELILRLFLKKSPEGLEVREVAFLSLGLGFGLLITELFFIAIAGYLYPSVVFAIFACNVACFAVLLLRKDGKIAQVLKRRRWSVESVVTLVTVLMLIVFQYSSAISMGIDDSTAYHVPYADFFLRNHGLGVDYHLIYPFHTLNINLIYSLALMLNRDLSYIQTVHALFATMAMFGVYVALMRYARLAWMAVLFTFAMAQIYTIRFGGNTANVDLGSMFFVFSAIYPLLLWHDHRPVNWLLVVSAVCFGIAMGSKYLMCIFALPIGLFLVMVEKKQALRPLVIYATTAALFGLWWYVRNYIMTGNPVHPFATGIFGFYLWDEFDMWNQMQNLQSGGVPPTITGFLAAPYYALQNTVLYQQHTFHVLAALYAGLLLLPFCSQAVRYLAMFCLVYIFFWTQGAPDPRYMLPTVPLVFLLLGSELAGVLRRLWLTDGEGMTRSGLTLTRMFSAVLTMMALGYAAFVTQQKFVNILYQSVEPQQAKVLLRRYFPSFELVEHANMEFGKDGVIFEFNFRNIRWYFDGTMLGTQFGEHGYLRVLRQAEKDSGSGYSPEKLDFILRNKYHAQGFMIANPPVYQFDLSEFDNYFVLLYRNSEGSLYRLRDADTHGVPGSGY